jgi:hypothetical protein
MQSLNFHAPPPAAFLCLCDSCTINGPSERASYVWDTRNNRRKGEEPIDANNHFMDMERYIVAHFDLDPASLPAEHGEAIW